MFDLITLPEGINWLSFWGLIIASCFTSMLTASLGIGGGMLMLAALSQLVPVKAIIPIHGIVQLGSNTGRALLMVKDVHWYHVLWFSLGGVFGAALGGHVVVSLPIDTLRIMLGLFILLSVWAPSLSTTFATKQSLFFGGAFSSFLTMFIGATGPFVLAMIRAFKLNSLSLVATSAACLVLQHALKVFTFFVLGFAFAPYLSLIVLMVASGVIGTIIGKRLLIEIDEKRFQYWLNIILSLLALRLLLVAVF
jgi:uncharacterized membrane protein YfcA